MAPSEGNRIWIFFFIFTQHLRISLMIKTDAKSAEQIAKAISIYISYIYLQFLSFYLNITLAISVSKTIWEVEKNKIEGTPILKLAMVKILQVKQFVKKIVKRFVSKDLSKKFVRKICQKNSPKKFVKKIRQFVKKIG